MAVRAPPIRHARAGWRPGRMRPRSPLPTTLLSHRTERSLCAATLPAAPVGRPPKIGQPARQQLHTWRAVQRRVERQVPAGRDDLTQRQPRRRPEIAGPAACSMSKSIPLRPIWSAMVSSERPGTSMRVANRARNHHTPPRNPSGIRVENVVPDQDVAGRSRIRPSAPPVVDASSTSQGSEGGSGGWHPPGHTGDVRQRARQADTLGDPAHHLPAPSAALHRWRRSARWCRSPAPRSGGTADGGAWRRRPEPAGRRCRRSSPGPGARPDVQANACGV